MRYRAIATGDPEFMVNWHVEMMLSCENRYKIGSIGAVYFFAAALSIFSFYDLQKRFGRVLIMGYSLAASLVCQAFMLTMCENLDTLLILMSFTGFTFVGKVSALMYLMEATPSTGRMSIIISVLTTQIGLSLLFIALTSWHIEYSWKMQQGIALGMGAGALIWIFFIPESPHILLVQNRQAAAKHALASIRAVRGDYSPVLPNKKIVLRKPLGGDERDDESRNGDLEYHTTNEQAPYYNSRNGQLYESRYMALVYNLTI